MKDNTARKGQRTHARARGARRTKGRGASISRPDLADLLSAVLTHPNLPQGLFDFITDGLCALPMNTNIFTDAHTLRVAYGIGAPEKGGKR
jgi:hypothetical protein